MESRALATHILTEVISNKESLTRVLSKQLEHEDISVTDRPFIKDLCYGVMRWQPRLDFLLDQLLDKPIKKKDLDLKVLAWVGLYQLIFQRTAEHGAVSATVEVCNTLKKSWAKGLINALLRRFLREQAQLTKTIEDNPTAQYAHPGWLLEKIQMDWPEHWLEIVNANNRNPPMTLRVNVLKISVDAYLALLKESGITGTGSSIVDTAIILEQACNVDDLPGFREGLVSIQDAAAQLAAPMLDVKKGQRVLDACAAPGSKSTHILETQPLLQELVCLDKQQQRLQKVDENLQRLGLEANLVNADVINTPAWWDGQTFDRILLDVPCSATGVIRRNPDIKLLRTQKEIDTISQLQSDILRSVWPLLKRQGKLVYSTCSILKQENDFVISEFINHQDDVSVLRQEYNWGVATEYGRQIFPGQHDMDGFYYAVLAKT